MNIIIQLVKSLEAMAESYDEGSRRNFTLPKYYFFDIANIVQAPEVVSDQIQFRHHKNKA
jgi:hypothetical protein